MHTFPSSILLISDSISIAFVDEVWLIIESVAIQKSHLATLLSCKSTRKAMSNSIQQKKIENTVNQLLIQPISPLPAHAHYIPENKLRQKEQTAGWQSASIKAHAPTNTQSCAWTPFHCCFQRLLPAYSQVAFHGQVAHVRSESGQSWPITCANSPHVYADPPYPATRRLHLSESSSQTFLHQTQGTAVKIIFVCVCV